MKYILFITLISVLAYILGLIYLYYHNIMIGTIYYKGLYPADCQYSMYFDITNKTIKNFLNKLYSPFAIFQTFVNPSFLGSGYDLNKGYIYMKIVFPKAHTLLIDFFEQHGNKIVTNVLATNFDDIIEPIKNNLIERKISKAI